jgi:hypothetical protein
MKKVPLAAEESRTLVGGVASHLQHPFGSWMFGQTGETDPARFQMNEKEHVVGRKTSPGEHLNGEESPHVNILATRGDVTSCIATPHTMIAACPDNHILWTCWLLVVK